MFERPAIERLQAAGFHVFCGTPVEDLRLLGWYSELAQSGELEAILPARQRSVFNFLQNFRPPNCLLYLTAEDDRIDGAIMLQPIYSTALVGYWMHESRRGAAYPKKAQGVFHDVFFSHFAVGIGITTHADRLDTFEGAGYKIAAHIPHLVDGESAYLLYFTREMYLRGKMK